MSEEEGPTSWNPAGPGLRRTARCCLRAAVAVLGDTEPALGETSWLFRGVLRLKILLLLGSVCLRGYEGVKFEIMHSLHIPHW